jgi:hypothetical protein
MTSGDLGEGLAVRLLLLPALALSDGVEAASFNSCAVTGRSLWCSHQTRNKALTV